MSLPRLCVFVSVLLLAMSGGAWAAPLERDVWYAFVDGDLRYGYQHVRVSKLPDGNFSFVSESRVLIDLFGSQRQEITGHTECVVSPTLRPVSLNSKSTQMSGESRAIGRMQGDKLTITVHRGGAESNSAFQITKSEPIIFGACFDDWLASLPRGTAEATITLLDDESWNVQRASVKRTHIDASGSTWEIDINGGLMRGIVRSDANGVVQEKIFEIPKWHMRRCTTEEAETIEYRTLNGREVLVFPLDKEIDAPHRLTSLTVKLEWENIPFAEFELQDHRQRVIDRSEQDGHFTAMVKISPPEAIAERIPYPVSGKEYKPYLAETPYIKPGDAQIMSVARKAVQGTETALDAVRALSQWVYAYIESGLIAETLSGPEVLASKKGKCSEYSTLFASLARSVGIPTRIVLGERIAGGQWMGHMWNEAYVGRWIPVDASVNEVGESISLLKFIHSNTVHGTQPLRWKLTNTLDISITDFTLSDSELASQYETGIVGNVYTNADYACRLAAPVPGWEIEDKSKTGVVTLRFRIPDADDVLIHFVAFALPPGTEPKTIIDARLGLFRSQFKQFEQLVNEPREVHGAKGRILRFSRVSEEEPPDKYRTTEVFWVRKSFGYLMNLIATEADHDKYLPDLEKLVAGFEHLGD